jgi:hypothetical protein
MEAIPYPAVGGLDRLTRAAPAPPANIVRATDLAAAVYAPGPLFVPRPGDTVPHQKWDSFHDFVRRYRDRTSPGVYSLVARRLAELGFWPLVLAPDAKAPLCRDWGTVRQDPGVFWWAERKLRAPNLGLVIGAAGGLVDLDVDDPDRAGPALAALFPNGVPPTLGWESARGWHRLFRYDPRLPAYGRPVFRFPGVELRAGAAPGVAKTFQVVVPPSWTDGFRRRWDDGRGVWPLPESVFAVLDSLTPRATNGGTGDPGGGASPPRTPEDAPKKRGWQTWVEAPVE